MIATPAQAPAPVDPEIAARIRLVVLDVDGVMTDGGVYLGAGGSDAIELKRFDIQDGLGIRLLREAGITLAIVTGRESQAVALRARELGIEEVHQDRRAAKLAIVNGVLARHGLSWDEVAMLGDDLPDLPILRRAGLPAAVGNATRDVRRVARWQGVRHGGFGAVREFAEALLEARGEWDARVEAYVRDREAGL